MKNQNKQPEYNIEESVLDPNWVTGFIDGEGCFGLKISVSAKATSGLSVKPHLTINLDRRDVYLLVRIKTFFSEVGHIRLNDTSVTYSVESTKALQTVVIPHFDKYPLITQKCADFLL
jgi:hypothetical protein